MAEVYTTTPGEVRQIGNFGQASNDTPAIVPDEVAAEFADHPLFRVEGITKKHTRELKEEAAAVAAIDPGKYETAEELQEATDKALRKVRRAHDRKAR